MIELWFQDEARVGQKNTLTCRWTRRGTRPAAPHDQRTKWAYIFAAIYPRKGKRAGLVMAYADWHMSKRLKVATNITLLPLALRAPALDPVENVWQFIRDNWPSNRVFESYEDIVTHCCDAWNKLIDRPWKINTIGMREWAHGF